MRINHFTLSFEGDDAHLEKNFTDYYYQASIIPVRISLALGFLIYGVFGVLDAIVVPELKGLFWLIRYAVVCPLIASAFVFSFFKGFRTVWQPYLTGVAVAAGFGIVVMIAKAPQSVSYSYYAGLILIQIFIAVMLRVRFVWANLASWMIILAYETAGFHFFSHLRP